MTPKRVLNLAVLFLLASLFLVACGDDGLAIQPASNTTGAAATATGGGGTATTAKSGTSTPSAATTAAITTSPTTTRATTTSSAVTTKAATTAPRVTTAPLATTAAVGGGTTSTDLPTELVYPGASEFKPTDSFKQVFSSLETSLKGDKAVKYYKTSDAATKVQSFYEGALDKAGFTKASSSVTAGSLSIAYLKGTTDVVYVLGFSGSIAKLGYNQDDVADNDLLFTVVFGKF